MSRWTALVQTSTGILQRVEFDSISPWRQDAISQAQSSYDAKVLSCNLVGNTYKPKESSPTNKTPNTSIGSYAGDWVGDLLAIPIFFVFVLCYIFWPIVKIILIVAPIVFLIWAIRKLRQP